MKIQHFIPGLTVSFAVSSLSWYLSTIHPSFDALVVSIIIGMFLGNIMSTRDYFREGIDAVNRIVLPAGIALYGSQLVFRGISPGALFAVFLVFLSLVGLTLIISDIFSINKKTALLLASGLSICGPSAIAVISPLIGARRTETSIAVISVLMLGLTGMIFYPVVNDVFSLTPFEFNFLAGTTLPMIGQVRVAAGNVCPDCIKSAMDIKLVRVSFLPLIFIMTGFLSGGQEKRARFPLFMVAFFVLAFLMNFTGLFEAAGAFFSAASTFFLSAGLASVGFSVDFDSLIEEGVNPLGVIGIAWIITLILMYIIRNIVYV